jgi:glyoxylase I family protein
VIVVKAIDHVVLRTDRLDDMLAFYGDVLGCIVERELPHIGLVQLRAGNSLIDLVPVDSELGRRGGGPPVTDGRNVEHVCLLIEHREEAAVLAFLQSKGIATESFAERYGATGFGPSLYIEDPQGNTVELKLGAANA